MWKEFYHDFYFYSFSCIGLMGRKMANLFLLCFILLFHPLAPIYANVEGDALYSLKKALTDPKNMIGNWGDDREYPCKWFHVTCNNENSVIRVDLADADLSGHLVPQLGQLRNLQYLILSNNSISGQIPSDLGNLTSLVCLFLYLNNFTGPIPDALGKLKNLRYLRLDNNNLTGQIPMSLTIIVTLQVLDLSSNSLSGSVPDNGSFSLFTPISFVNNPDLCGPVTGKPCPGALPFSPPPPFISPSSATSSGSSASSTRGIIERAVAGAVFFVVVAAAIGFAW